jgi:secretion/DNA translocation related TadE-like protein
MVKLGDDTGAVTLLALAAISGIVTLASASVCIASFASVHARAAMVADLAALAGAHHGSCAPAHAVVNAHGGELRTCGFEGVDVVVGVSLPVTVPGRGWLLPPTADASARAGY